MYLLLRDWGISKNRILKTLNYGIKSSKRFNQKDALLTSTNEEKKRIRHFYSSKSRIKLYFTFIKKGYLNVFTAKSPTNGECLSSQPGIYETRRSLSCQLSLQICKKEK